MCFFLFSCTHQGSWKTHVGMYLDMYHMKIEEITSKTQKQNENNSPWISRQRVKNITFAKKFITIPVSEKEDGQLSIYNVSVGTRMQFCMDLKLSKRNVQPLTIKRWIWAPIAIAQLGLNHFETKLEFPTSYFLDLRWNEKFYVCENYLPIRMSHWHNTMLFSEVLVAYKWFCVVDVSSELNCVPI